MSNEIILPRLVVNGSKIDREMNKKIIRRNADRRKALEYCWDCVNIEHCTKMRTCEKTRHLFKDDEK